MIVGADNLTRKNKKMLKLAYKHYNKVKIKDKLTENM